MAYPTNVNFKGTSQIIGGQPPNASATTATAVPGTVTKGVDATKGEAEFIYLAGVASTAPGDLVIYDPVAGTTTRTVAASRGPVAVAMSANGAGAFGQYQIRGYAIVSTTAAGTGAANALLAVSAVAGQATVSGAAGNKIDGAICKTAQDAPGAGFTGVLLMYPCANGNT
jgi:hypothetical protein